MGGEVSVCRHGYERDARSFQSTGAACGAEGRWGEAVADARARAQSVGRSKVPSEVEVLICVIEECYITIEVRSECE